MVSENDIFACCAIIIHPKDPSLILGVSRKNNHADFGFPGGKRDMLSYASRLEDSKACVIRELFEETGISVTNSSTNAKLVYTGIDSTGKWCKCFWIKRCNSYNFIQKENEGIVKWCTWEELGNGCFGDFNLTAKRHLDKLFSKVDNPSMPLIGKEVTRMANADWSVCFDEDGNMNTNYSSYAKYDGATQPYVFGADLEIFKMNKRGHGTTSFSMLDQKTNVEYLMNAREFYNMLKIAKSDCGLISGFWSFEKSFGSITLRYFMGKKES